jgi:S1-C subfamily serine protease
MRWWIALAGLLLAFGSLSPLATSAQTSQLDDDEYEQAILATNKIFILGPDDKAIGTCTGTTLNQEGYILTNFHCIGHTDLYGPDDSGLGLSHGDLYHPDGLVVIAPTQDDRRVPVPTYVAQAVSGNPTFDVAVVKIVGTLKGQKPPRNLPLVPITLADSETVKTRDFVGVIGYPGVGGPTLTYTEGQISGFEDQDGDGEIDSFKTTAEIAGGNSGGLAVNADGHQIGIPTYGAAQGADKIDRIKMINAALPVIEEALGAAPINNGNDPAPSPNPNPRPNTKGVVLQGQIVDANTKRGVNGALIIILQPGVTAEDFEESGFSEELVAAIGSADRSGHYRTAPALARGEVYTVIVGAKGYQPRVFENALEITNDDPEVTKLETIAIERQ